MHHQNEEFRILKEFCILNDELCRCLMWSPQAAYSFQHFMDGEFFNLDKLFGALFSIEESSFPVEECWFSIEEC